MPLTSPARILFILLGCGISVLQAVGETPVELARAHFQAKRYTEAQDLLQKLSVDDPNNAEVHYYLGILALRQNQLDAGIAHLEKATVLAPTNSNYFLELGGAYGGAAQKAGLFSKMGLAKKCHAAFEQSVALDPDNLNARNALVSYYRMAPAMVGGGMDKAYAQAEEIRKRDQIMGQSVFAQLYVSEKKYDEAIAAFAEVAKARPNDHYAHYEIGRVVSDTGRQLERGEEALHRCLDLTPQPKRPGQANVHWRLGLIAERRGDREAARALYKKALSLNPDLKEARESLGKLK